MHLQSFLEDVRTVLRDTVNAPAHQNFTLWSADVRERCVSDVVKEIEQQMAAPNPVQAVRMRLIEFMVTAARFDVLVMAPTPLRPTPLRGISGELTEYIPQLCAVDEEFVSFFNELTDPCESVAQMEQVILMRYWVAHLYLDGFGLARMALGDYDADPTIDWFRPCYYSLRIHREHSYRKVLGLPAEIDGSDPDRRALIHSVWLTRALEGHKDLRTAWGISWTQMFKESSPYEGSALEW